MAQEKKLSCQYRNSPLCVSLPHVQVVNIFGSSRSSLTQTPKFRKKLRALKSKADLHQSELGTPRGQ